MKIIAMTIQITRTSQKLLKQNISPWKETLSKKLGFSVNPTALTLLSKVRPCTIILVQDRFFNLTIWKPTTQAFQNTLTFDRYLFNSMSNFHENLVHWNSLHPINAILPTFLGQTPHFLCENEKNRTDNLHHRKALSVAVILSLRVGVQHIQKVVQYFLQRGGSRMYTVSCKASHLFYRHNLSYHDLLSTACNIFWFKVMPHSKSTNKRILFPEAPFCTVCTQWRGNTLAQTA